MTASVQDLLNQLRVVIGKLDEAATIAQRAQVDAEQAVARFADAGLGTAHPRMVRAKADASEAAAKAGKLARLYAQAAAAYARYANHIAPGTLPDRLSAPEALPSGAILVDDAGERGARSEVFLRKQIQNLGDTHDAVEQAEQLVTSTVTVVVRALKAGPPGSTTAITEPAEPPPQERPHLDNPVTAAVMAAGAIAAAGKTAVDQARKRATRKKRTDDDHA